MCVWCSVSRGLAACVDDIPKKIIHRKKTHSRTAQHLVVAKASSSHYTQRAAPNVRDRPHRARVCVSVRGDVVYGGGGILRSLAPFVRRGPAH